MLMQNLTDFVTKIPKSDLHVHLDGSVRIDTLIDISKKEHLTLPSYTPEGLNELVFKEQYANLVEYLTGFAYTVPALQTAENLERVSYEFAIDNINEGVRYVEVRFAPQLHVNDQLDIEKILLSVDSGLKRAQQEHNHRPEVKSGEVPEFNYGIIVGAMRFFVRGMSKAFDLLFDALKYSHHNFIFKMAAVELIKACVHARDKHGIPVVAFDLLGAESGNPPIHYLEAYRFAHQSLMNTIVHAGEAYGAESIFQAVTELNPERLGHGTNLFSKDQIVDAKIQDKKSYIERLVEYIAKRRITIEVCLTSNLQTIPAIREIKNHPFHKMLDHQLSTTICTDNRVVSKTSMTKELVLAISNFNLDLPAIKNLVMSGFANSFYFGSYADKQKYLTKVSTYFDRCSVSGTDS